MTSKIASERITVGDVVAEFLAHCGVGHAFGVISIHNMPILDAFARQGRIRFVGSRGEAGAVNMADAAARVGGGIGVAVTSTGTAAGNACGAMVEAQTAGTPVLHLTGQIERDYLDRNRGYIHEARDQLAMLRSVSKEAYRVWSPETALGTLREAVRVALTPPAGPVSVEIPIDVQQAEIVRPADLAPAPIEAPAPSPAAIDGLADALAAARRPLLWLGGGARHAGAEVRRLVELGFGVVTSVQGRGVVAEGHPLSLGSYNLQPPVEAFYATCDAMVVAGSRLRGNETLKYTLRLPRPLFGIDTDPMAENRSYPLDRFVTGDAALALGALADRLDGRMNIDPAFAGDLAAAREAAEAGMRDSLGPYNAILDAILATVPEDLVWVRDITLSNSMWGNRLPRLQGPRDGVHALGGGIGQGIAMAVGAALAAPGRKTVALSGDGGFYVSLGELATAVQENADVAFVVMNDKGYGVIRNIQDAHYGGRRHYADLHMPDFDGLSRTMGLPYHRVAKAEDMAAALEAAIAVDGPALVEVDMTAIGPFARPFAGPPVRKSD
jgi:acetolactate synthase-1/2/3 large subunit